LSESRGFRRIAVFLFQVKLESNFASIVFAIMVLEGLGRSLDPKLDILEVAKPFLLKGPSSYF
jgi:aarF domain-containing kinase